VCHPKSFVTPAASGAGGSERSNFFRRRSTPDKPCVVEDIIARLAAPSNATCAARGQVPAA
jgi:hypothetical protein